MTGARFLIVNVMLAAVGIAYWQLGVFDAFPAIRGVELVLLGTLLCYGALGIGAAVVAARTGDWRHVAHIANGAPKWALAFTGLGLVLAFSQIRTLDGGALPLLQAAIYAILPNIVGIALLSWLSEIAHWAGGETL